MFIREKVTRRHGLGNGWLVSKAKSSGQFLKKVFCRLVYEVRQWPSRPVMRAVALMQDRPQRKNYRSLLWDDLLQRRKSDMVFLFGCGYSINQITPQEWEDIANHNTLSFNWFFRQSFIRMDYHVIREIGGFDSQPELWKPYLEEWSSLLNPNPFYENTLFLVEEGWKAISGNRAIGLGYLKQGAPVFRFKSGKAGRGIKLSYSRSIEKGTVRAGGSLTEAINWAYLLGWKRIVLVGIDLYDRRYFWLKPDETRSNDRMRNASHTDRHNMADSTVSVLERWGKEMAAEGIRLECYNPKSLLADVLPLYVRSSASNTSVR